MITLISHFYNEEFLLPFWLKHHVKMFDHGVLIDYASTDRSIEIIKDLAPHWEIRPSRNREFHYLEVDCEVMDIEREFSGWKMALNTTEFLVHPNLREYLEGKKLISGIRTTGIIMVDRIEDRNLPLTDELLVKQKHYGYVERDQTPHVARSRLIHKCENGMYSGGRHTSCITEDIADDLFLCWFGWCPIDYVKSRKLQIKTKIPVEDFEKSAGIQHNINEQQLENLYYKESQLAVDLWEKSLLFKSYINQL